MISSSQASLTSWKIKPLSPIRSSDRRKIADQIISNFDIVIPTSEHREKGISNEASTALSIGDIRNSLLPEGSLSARFTTTIGPDLNQVTGTVYVGAPAQQEQRVLWIKIEENLIPSGLFLHIVKGSQVSQLTIGC